MVSLNGQTSELPPDAESRFGPNGPRSHCLVAIVRSMKAALLVAALLGAMLSAPTATAQECHPSYSGKCVPIASDVDCAGGSGNGPAYVAGPVQVIGDDVYGLDRDGDGVACD